MEEAPRRPHRQRYLRNQPALKPVTEDIHIPSFKRLSKKIMPSKSLRARARFRNAVYHTMEDVRLVKRLELIDAFITTNLRTELYLATTEVPEKDKPIWKAIETDMILQEHVVNLEEERKLWKQWNRGNQTEGRPCSVNPIPHVCTCDQHISVPVRQPKNTGKGKGKGRSRPNHTRDPLKPEVEENGYCGCCCQKKPRPHSPRSYPDVQTTDPETKNSENDNFNDVTTTNRTSNNSSKQESFYSLSQSSGSGKQGSTTTLPLSDTRSLADVETRDQSAASSQRTLITDTIRPRQSKNITNNNNTVVGTVSPAQEKPASDNVSEISTVADATTNTVLTYPIRQPKPEPPKPPQKSLRTTKAQLYHKTANDKISSKTLNNSPQPNNAVKIYRNANKDINSYINKKRSQFSKIIQTSSDTNKIDAPIDAETKVETSKSNLTKNKDTIQIEEIGDAESMFQEEDKVQQEIDKNAKSNAKSSMCRAM